jgi:hypothetical protein
MDLLKALADEASRREELVVWGRKLHAKPNRNIAKKILLKIPGRRLLQVIHTPKVPAH